MRFRLRLRSLLVLAAILLVVPPAAAQYGTEGDDDIRQTVARVAFFDGEVSFNRGDDPDDWQPATRNYPMTLGDRVWAGRNGRVELQLRGARVYLGPETELATLDLTRDVRQLSLSLGTASFRINRLDRDDVFEVATPNVSVTFETPGVYRIDVDEEGNSRVSVQQGRASAAAAGGQVALERGDQMRVRGVDRPDYDIVGLARLDSWDRWVEVRARRFRSIRSVSYVHPDIYGVDDLDEYGSWESTTDYGSVWYPRGVASGWEPYRSGRWIWRDPWGWTWLSSEPWGWAPYHYGRWAVVRGRWGWVPVGPSDRYPSYSPALVGFVGGGAGISFSVSVGGFVGWFPLGPREPFDPWWHTSRSTASVTGFNYAYRNRATVVARNVFVESAPVDRAIVRDTRVVREISTAPVLRGPIPVLPTRDSIRVSPVSVQGRASIAPPARIVQREVVTRTAPPPAPPTFDRKIEVIRERGGAAVPVDVARRLSVDQNRGEKGAQPVRPAAREGVQLTPRGDVKASRRPQPLPPSAVRPPVTRERTMPGRAETQPPPAPESRREAETVRPTAVPGRVDVPARPPAPGRPPASQPELNREPAPTRPAPEARPERREVARPPERGFDRPGAVPTPRVEPTPAPEGRREADTVRPTAVPRRFDVPARPPVMERPPAPPTEARPEPTATRPVPEARPERREVARPPDRIFDRPVAVPTPRVEPTPAPEPRREVETVRPTAVPRRFDVPARPPVMERPPAPPTETRPEPTPTRPVPEARPERREVARPPERGFERPAPVSTPRAERPPAPEGRRERVEPKPAEGSPDKVEPKKAEPGRRGQRPTPTPTPNNE